MIKPDYESFMGWGITSGAGLGVLYTAVIIMAAFASLENNTGDAPTGGEGLLLLCCFVPLILGAIVGATGDLC